MIRTPFVLAAAVITGLCTIPAQAQTVSYGTTGKPAASSAMRAKVIEHTIGRPNAPTTVHEFLSLTDPASAAFHAQTFPKITQAYINTGKVRWMFHVLPTEQAGLYAASIGEAIPTRLYGPYIASMLAQQPQWAHATGAHAMQAVKDAATKAGASDEDILASDNYERPVAASAAITVQSMHIDRTPKYIVTGTAIPALDALLNNQAK